MHRRQARGSESRRGEKAFASSGSGLFRRHFFINWFLNHGRKFPWRHADPKPFEILITEMLLRQTRAGNVAKIWIKFTRDFPTYEAVLQTPRRRLISRLHILGFSNQRASALKAAAEWIRQKHQGKVPDNLEELLKIPHIGQYSARAVLCFAFNKRVEIVDTNVLRFFSRYFGEPLPADIRRAPEAWRIARAILPRGNKNIQMHNYGLLDFTGEICKSGTPRCSACPLASSCVFNNRQLRTVSTRIGPQESPKTSRIDQGAR
jgi:A/G-specific adenine glycosylase